jgi:hypothetical protein
MLQLPATASTAMLRGFLSREGMFRRQPGSGRDDVHQKKGKTAMEFFAPFNLGFWILLLALCGLIGLLVVIRNKREEE